MLEAQIETGIPNWYFRIQKRGNKMNIIMHRDMFEFSLVVDASDFQQCINTLYLMEDDETEEINSDVRRNAVPVQSLQQYRIPVADSQMESNEVAVHVVADQT